MKKMKKIIFASVVLLSGSGCASTHHVSNAQPAIIQATLPKPDYQLMYGNDDKVKHAYEQYLKTGKAPNIITSGFIQFAYGQSQPVIEASPFEITVITLEKGENVLRARTGDPTRWSCAPAYSGEGEEKRAYVMIKPLQPSISTNMVITTNKRMYILKIVSTNDGKYFRDVRFWYPDEIEQSWGNYNSSQGSDSEDNSTISSLPDVHLKNLNFNYSIRSSFFNSPIWKPVRVFDDGVHTYVQMPENVSSSDLPTLFISDSSDSNKSLVNYRYKKPYFIVDKIFKRAVLMLGVGSGQSQVTLINDSL